MYKIVTYKECLDHAGLENTQENWRFYLDMWGLDPNNSSELNKHLSRLDPDGIAPAQESFASVDRPPHYTAGAVECIDALESATANLTGIEAVCTANAIKYLWRWKAKGGLEDLRKAGWYIKRLISYLERGGEKS